MTARTLVIDDSTVDRRALVEVLNAAREIEVIGTAATGSIGLQKIAHSLPDVVLLDATLSDPGAVATVRAIRATWPRLPVLMVFASTGRLAALDAIKSGANDYVANPSTLGGPEECARGAAELVAKVRALTQARHSVPVSSPARLTSQPQSRKPASLTPVAAIAIGASTGGPNALTQVFASLPRDLPVPILIVQHMPPVFTRQFAERLTASGSFEVVEAVHDARVEPGRAYIAPGDFHMMVARDPARCGDVRIVLHQGPREGSCRPAIDVLFRSMAAVYGSATLAAVLTGMGYDGTSGARRIAEVGGTILVQDDATSVISTMPASVAAAVDVDGVYPIGNIAAELLARVRRRALRPRLGRETPDSGRGPRDSK